MTVRDEVALLRSNLLYHRHVGVERVYLYDDGSTDATLTSVSKLSSVQIQASVPPERFDGRGDLVDDRKNAERQFTARQALNAADALDRARRDGLDWLLHLDADEVVCLDPLHAGAGCLARLLEGLPAETEAVLFKPTLEVVQHRLDYADVLAEETLFKAPDAKIERRLHDPYLDKYWTLRGSYGHDGGKSAVRLSVDARPESPHRFTARDGRELQLVRKRGLLHYFAYSFADFLKRHAGLQDTPTFYGPWRRVERQKRLWRAMVNDSRFSQQQLRDYYAGFVLFSADEVARLRRGRRRFGIFPVAPAIVEITAVRDAMAAIAAGAEAV
jgi:hypothetical protein